ncbi:terminase large subunit, partial [Bacillus cereus]|nr:terminase large subunit [Bacillus cereus]
MMTMTSICNVYRYHPYINEYMELVESRKIRSCKEQKQLMKLVRETLDDPNVYLDVQ